MTIRFVLLIVPTVLLSAYVLLVLGFLVHCSISGCLGSANQSVEAILIGVFVVVAAALPLTASLVILIAHLRKKRLSSVAKALIWAVITIAGALGYYQVLTDPGDAFWAGVPLMTASALLALSLWSFPKPH